MDDEHLALFRYSDVPGMVGRVGTCFGEHGINISNAAVGRQPPGEDGGAADVAVMAVTTDAPVPQSVIDEIASSDGFLAGRAVSLG
jgi:D-3-phosphoglycerate dehydrogenase